MEKKKIKVFLSGVVNSTNAQNLNCRALMRHLDPEKFEVRALTVYSGDLGSDVKICRKEDENVHCSPSPSTFTYLIRYPAKIWHPVQLVRGILWADVAYLCKPEYWRLQRFLIRLLRKKAFKTIEGAFVGTNIDKALAAEGTRECVRQSLAYTGNTYSITEAMKAVNERALGLRTREKVLYLGAETDLFRNDVRREKLTDVAMIGGNLFYKGLDDFFKLAGRFPQLTFHVIGSGMGKVDPKAEAQRLGLENVVCHGSLSHAELAETLKAVQLHIFPSRAEGFPKVTLETAAAGVPSLVYGDYGADEWIASASADEVKVRGEGEGLSGKSGFVVQTIEEMASVVQALLDHSEALQPISDGARAMAKRFDWKVLVKDWEREIEGINAGNGKANVGQGVKREFFQGV